MDDATIRRYLSESRLTVLDIVDAGGARNGDDVASAWIDRRASIAPTHARRLSRVSSQFLWQLANLQWIERVDGEWAVTALGRHARDLAAARW